MYMYFFWIGLPYFFTNTRLNSYYAFFETNLSHLALVSQKPICAALLHYSQLLEGLSSSDNNPLRILREQESLSSGVSQDNSFFTGAIFSHVEQLIRYIHSETSSSIYMYKHLYMYYIHVCGRWHSAGGWRWIADVVPMNQ